MKGFAVWLDETGERWDFKGAKAAIFKNSHPDFVPLGHFVEEQTVLARPSETPEKEWPVYGVSNKDGVFLSHMQLGSEFPRPIQVNSQGLVLSQPDPSQCRVPRSGSRGPRRRNNKP